ncbi:Hypothetical protein, putative phosphoglucomutase/phosphomannomutase [Mycoplasmopsis bovigenitalium 51080]|uniref:Alpha-D-phosphohexomutase alpha/beta/alpha domain-containing protein n=1 Tax=Mycoplasmopsis bovigenitalium 51080 TaxID=1188235 RepID=N9TT46_9BACT|nr:lysylphosphatidylglycerol synthase transmembrane domain-containing protein [Mycoplasmopsis bovigenitalium]ENY69215.1 Hypothetical protein, putative phosphoglucomutase/phosphomannomutase [Mycoplasmopsis bovigenitalium 51080]
MSKSSLFNKLDLDNDQKDTKMGEITSSLVTNQFEKYYIDLAKSEIVFDANENTNSLEKFSYNLAQSFCKINSISKNSNNKIFLASDAKINSQNCFNTFASVLTQNNYKVISVANSQLTPLQIHKYSAIKNNCENTILFKTQNNKIHIIFYDSAGFLLENQKMQEIINEIPHANFEKQNYQDAISKIEYVESYKDYLNEIANLYKNYEYLGKKSLKFGLDFSNYSASNFFKEGLEKLKLNVFYKTRKKDAKYFNLENQKYLKQIYWKGLFNGAKANFVINEDSSAINLCIKHKSLFKFFKPDELAAIYLHFLLTEDKNITKDELNKFVIAKNNHVGTLTKKIAEINGIQTIDFIDKSLIYKTVEKTDKKLLFAFTSNYEFLSHNSITNDFDAYQFLFEILRMINFYNAQKNKNLFEILEEIYKTYGRHQLTTKSYDLNAESAARFIERLKQSEKIGDKYKIVRFQELTNPNDSENLYQLSFQNKESTYIKYEQSNNLLKIYCETLENKSENDQELTMVVRNHEILNGLIDLKEDNQESKISKKSVIKFGLYFAVFAAIICFLFYTVYNIDDGSDSGPIAVISAIIKKLYTRFDIAGSARPESQGYLVRSAFAFMCLSFLATSIIHAWVFKKLIKLQGGYVKWNDVYTGTVIGLIVQTLTPKSIGGDLATYWFLRRRDVARPIMMSSIIINTCIWQLTNIISTIIFVPMGIVAFENFFKSDNPAVKFFILMLALGLIFDTGLAIISLIMTISIKVQNFIIKLVMALIEWFPFINIYDSFAVKAKFKYEFFNIRQCMKKIFKNPWNFIELVIIKMVPIFVLPNALLAKSLDMVKPDIKYGYYINMTVQAAITRVANSVSLTPGGTGTSDVLYKSIVHGSLQDTIYDAQNIESNASLITAMTTLGSVLMASTISAILLMIVYIGERRVDFYRKKAKNHRLLSSNDTTKNVKLSTNYYKISLSLFYIVLFILTVAFIFAH